MTAQSQRLLSEISPEFQLELLMASYFSSTFLSLHSQKKVPTIKNNIIQYFISNDTKLLIN
jgi:hypothetical protein